MYRQKGLKKNGGLRLLLHTNEFKGTLQNSKINECDRGKFRTHADNKSNFPFTGIPLVHIKVFCFRAVRGRDTDIVLRPKYC